MDPDESATELAETLRDDDEELGADSDEDEDDGDNARGAPIKYSYSFFHTIFALAAMYTAMLLTGWGTRHKDDSEAVGSGWASVAVKFGSVWVTGGMYLWALIAPALFPDREF